VAKIKRFQFQRISSAARGLLESSGDIVDALLNIAPTLAEYHHEISNCLSGQEVKIINVTDLERPLDHFVHARWMRGSDKVIKAKDNVEYVRVMNRWSRRGKILSSPVFGDSPVEFFNRLPLQSRSCWSSWDEAGTDQRGGRD